MKSSEPVGEAKIDFGLAKSPQISHPMNGNLGTYDASFFNDVRLDGWHSGKAGDDLGPPITPQQEAQVTGLTVQFKAAPPFRLEFGKFAAPLMMLRQCADGLVTAWGYDAEVQKKLQRRVTPRSSPARWLTSDDYPMGPLRMGESGFVQVRLDVDPSGTIADCHLVNGTKEKEFAEVVCRAIAKRASLDPALDEHGQPVPSYLLLGFRFELDE